MIKDFIMPCLVPFITKKHNNAHVVFKSKDFYKSYDTILDEYSWVIPDKNEYNPGTERIFFAERYGGIGNGIHGGGARCGYDGNKYQTKGIGQTPLIGTVTTDDLGQSNGELDIYSAIYEGLWSVILQDILPHGVNKCLAIIYLNDINLSNQRALIIREICLRPAHFIPAAYFKKNSEEPESERKKDVQRVVDMCMNLAIIMKKTFNLQSNVDDDIINTGLSIFVRRQAKQLGFSLSHFLYHSISSSNFSIDGKWHDFTSLSQLDPFNLNSNNIIPSSWSSLWNQGNIIKNTIKHWIFQYTKSCHRSDSFQYKISNTLINKFDSELEKSLSFYFLCAFGTPKLIAKKIYLTKNTRNWLTSLINILKTLPQKQNEYFTCGENGLLALSFHPQQFNRTSQLNKNKPELQSYIKFREKVFHEIVKTSLSINISKENITFGMILNAQKFLTINDSLNYKSIMKEIESLVSKNCLSPHKMADDISSFFKRKIIEGRLKYHYENGIKITISNEKDIQIKYNLILGVFHIVSESKEIIIESSSLHNYLIENDLTKTKELLERINAFVKEVK